MDDDLDQLYGGDASTGDTAVATAAPPISAQSRDSWQTDTPQPDQGAAADTASTPTDTGGDTAPIPGPVAQRMPTGLAAVRSALLGPAAARDGQNPWSDQTDTATPPPPISAQARDDWSSYREPAPPHSNLEDELLYRGWAPDEAASAAQGPKAQAAFQAMVDGYNQNVSQQQNDLRDFSTNYSDAYGQAVSQAQRDATARWNLANTDRNSEINDYSRNDHGYFLVGPQPPGAPSKEIFPAYPGVDYGDQPADTLYVYPEARNDADVVGRTYDQYHTTEWRPVAHMGYGLGDDFSALGARVHNALPTGVTNAYDQAVRAIRLPEYQPWLAGGFPSFGIGNAVRALGNGVHNVQEWASGGDAVRAADAQRAADQERALDLMYPGRATANGRPEPVRDQPSDSGPTAPPAESPLTDKQQVASIFQEFSTIPKDDLVERARFMLDHAQELRDHGYPNVESDDTLKLAYWSAVAHQSSAHGDKDALSHATSQLAALQGKEPPAVVLTDAEHARSKELSDQLNALTTPREKAQFFNTNRDELRALGWNVRDAAPFVPRTGAAGGQHYAPRSSYAGPPAATPQQIADRNGWVQQWVNYAALPDAKAKAAYLANHYDEINGIAARLGKEPIRQSQDALTAAAGGASVPAAAPATGAPAGGNGSRDAIGRIFDQYNSLRNEGDHLGAARYLDANWDTLIAAGYTPKFPRPDVASLEARQTGTGQQIRPGVDAAAVSQPGAAHAARNVDSTTKVLIYDRDQIPPAQRQNYVIDHVVPLALGGSNDASNLRAQPVAEARAKDVVELWLHGQVKFGRMSLEDAQNAIATDWKSVYNGIPGATRYNIGRQLASANGQSGGDTESSGAIPTPPPTSTVPQTPADTFRPVAQRPVPQPARTAPPPHQWSPAPPRQPTPAAPHITRGRVPVSRPEPMRYSMPRPARTYNVPTESRPMRQRPA